MLIKLSETSQVKTDQKKSLGCWTWSLYFKVLRTRTNLTKSEFTEKLSGVSMGGVSGVSGWGKWGKCFIFKNLAQTKILIPLYSLTIEKILYLIFFQ